MPIQVVEGQQIAAKYTLQYPIATNVQWDCWLALDDRNNEQVLLKLFKEPLTHDEINSIQHNIERQTSLLHSQVARTQAIDKFADTYFLSIQYIPSTRPLPQDLSFKTQWPFLRQIAECLNIAHSLGFAHGNLHPGNILINTANKVVITDFSLGLPVNKGNINSDQDTYLSPQANAGLPADSSDDIYSFAQLVTFALTRNIAQPGQDFTTTLPIADEFKQILTSMLQPSAYNRPVNFNSLIQVADNYAQTIDDPVDPAAAAFNRTDGTQSQGLTAHPGSENKISHTLPRERNTISSLTAVFGLVLLVGIAAGLFLYLPAMSPAIPSGTSNTHTQPSKTTQAITPPGQLAPVSEPSIGPLAEAKLKNLALKGKNLATELLRLQIKLEDIGGQIWAADAYQAVVASGLAGDDAYRENEFELAFSQYQQAIDALNSIIATKDATFERNQQAGQLALQQGKTLKAIEAFTILNAITPDQPEIKAWLLRAENLQQVKNLISEGQAIERDGDLAGALTQFEAALSLDGLWVDALTAVKRVKKQLAINAFNSQMSLAFTALNNKDFKAAQIAFEQAQSILPKSPEPQDGLQQVEIAKTQSEMSAHYALAEQYGNEEKWPRAIDEYETILSQIAGAVAATDGLANAARRLSLEKALQQYIAQPNLMYSDLELASAKKSLLQAARISQPGPNLNQQINRLSHLISLARIPINVELISDNKTTITLLKHQNFGRLESTSLKLNPGIYTFVGERKGYRAVQQEINLLGGQRNAPILISCTERI
ncbi:MAG: protein kinase [Pseudomonadales bacterium]|nr:protein kinase [Pseudomonadales bacterium]